MQFFSVFSTEHMFYFRGLVFSSIPIIKEILLNSLFLLAPFTLHNLNNVFMPNPIKEGIFIHAVT